MAPVFVTIRSQVYDIAQYEVGAVAPRILTIHLQAYDTIGIWRGGYCPH